MQLEENPRRRLPSASFWTPGEGLAWVAALIFTLSSFMGWYTGSVEGLDVSILAWHSGALGKLVLFVGLAVLAVLLLRAAGVELPPTVAGRHGDRRRSVPSALSSS